MSRAGKVIDLRGLVRLEAEQITPEDVERVDLAVAEDLDDFKLNWSIGDNDSFVLLPDYYENGLQPVIEFVDPFTGDPLDRSHISRRNLFDWSQRLELELTDAVFELRNAFHSRGEPLDLVRNMAEAAMTVFDPIHLRLMRMLYWMGIVFSDGLFPVKLMHIFNPVYHALISIKSASPANSTRTGNRIVMFGYDIAGMFGEQARLFGVERIHCGYEPNLMYLDETLTAGQYSAVRNFLYSAVDAATRLGPRSIRIINSSSGEVIVRVEGLEDFSDEKLLLFKIKVAQTFDQDFLLRRIPDGFEAALKLAEARFLDPITREVIPPEQITKEYLFDMSRRVRESIYKQLLRYAAMAGSVIDPKMLGEEALEDSDGGDIREVVSEVENICARYAEVTGDESSPALVRRRVYRSISLFEMLGRKLAKGEDHKGMIGVSEPIHTDLIVLSIAGYIAGRKGLKNVRVVNRVSNTELDSRKDINGWDLEDILFALIEYAATRATSDVVVSSVDDTTLNRIFIEFKKEDAVGDNGSIPDELKSIKDLAEKFGWTVTYNESGERQVAIGLIIKKPDQFEKIEIVDPFSGEAIPESDITKKRLTKWSFQLGADLRKRIEEVLVLLGDGTDKTVYPRALEMLDAIRKDFFPAVSRLEGLLVWYDREVESGLFMDGAGHIFKNLSNYVETLTADLNGGRYQPTSNPITSLEQYFWYFRQMLAVDLKKYDVDFKCADYAELGRRLSPEQLEQLIGAIYQLLGILIAKKSKKINVETTEKGEVVVTVAGSDVGWSGLSYLIQDLEKTKWGIIKKTTPEGFSLTMTLAEGLTLDEVTKPVSASKGSKELGGIISIETRGQFEYYLKGERGVKYVLFEHPDGKFEMLVSRNAHDQMKRPNAKYVGFGGVSYVDGVIEIDGLSGAAMQTTFDNVAARFTSLPTAKKAGLVEVGHFIRERLPEVPIRMYLESGEKTYGEEM